MPEWVPDWFVDFLDGVTLLDVVLWVILAVTVVFALRKVGPWVLAFSRAILSTATLIDSVQGLPAFIKRTDETNTTQNATFAEIKATLAVQDERIAEIHHETHTNNGSSIKDAVVRTEEVLNTQVLPALKTLQGDGAQLREDFDKAQTPEVHVTVNPKKEQQP